ncbi:MAG TPA: hypothetical protein VH583_16245 [Vicinamibacterales bacterium]|jgi:hypothetical protein
MAHIDCLQLCDTAFLDNCDRLCLIGVINRLPVQRLPIAVHQLVLVGRIVGLRPGEEVEIGVSITTPSGLSPAPDDPQCMEITNAGEYVLVTLRQFPLHEEGVYRFAVTSIGSNTMTVDIPVLLVSSVAHAQVH